MARLLLISVLIESIFILKLQERTLDNLPKVRSFFISVAYSY